MANTTGLGYRPTRDKLFMINRLFKLIAASPETAHFDV